MTKEMKIEDIVEEIFQSVLASPKKQRRLYSKTFWGKFGFKARSHQRVEAVQAALKQRGLMFQILNEDDALIGKEDGESWLVLTYVKPEFPTSDLASDSIPTPPDTWFERLETTEFESEREVEYYFVMPLFEQLGYDEEDIAIGFGVEIFEGVTKRKKQADLVLFDGSYRSKDNALVIVEAKMSPKGISGDAVGQARAYAMWLAAPYYIVTNGDEIQVHLCRGGGLPDVPIMLFRRARLKDEWKKLFAQLNKEAVIEYKKKLLEQLAASS